MKIPAQQLTFSSHQSACYDIGALPNNCFHLLSPDDVEFPCYFKTPRQSTACLEMLLQHTPTSLQSEAIRARLNVTNCEVPSILNSLLEVKLY